MSLSTLSIAAAARLAILCCGAALAACSSQPEGPDKDTRELFYTEITEHGLKQFTYSLQRRVDRPDRGGLASLSRPGAGNAEVDSRKRRQRYEEWVIAWMEAKLAESGFCRHGYFIIDKTLTPGATEIRGECKSVSEG